MGREPPEIGAVFEIPTPNGLGYGQFTHEHDDYGELVRVLPGLFAERPANLPALVAGPERYFVFYVLRTALKDGLVALVGTFPIPEHAVRFPTLRSGMQDPQTGKTEVWWLWDGENEWRVGELTPDQRRLSTRGIINHPRLVERLLGSWTPEDRA